MSDLEQLLTGIILVAGVTLFIAMFTAPFEAMTWWSRWTTDPDAHAYPEKNEEVNAQAEDVDSDEKQAVVFFVTGIGTITGERHPELEEQFLDYLKQRLPQATVIDDFFPYSPAGIPLTGQRIFARFWRFSGRHRAFVTQNLIRLRNLFQVMVAADGRYGPIYSAGSSRIIREKLIQNGHMPNSQRPVILLGYSGGAEISLGVAPFLNGEFGCRLTLLSLGGVLSSHPGIKSLDRIVHIQGSNDRVARLGGFFFIHRWPIFGQSHWNRARKRGLISTIRLRGIAHNGPGGYLDPEQGRGGGRSNLERTVNTIVGVVNQEIDESQSEPIETRS
ncbi:MAG: hypothetical protein AAF724_15625 [Pseudomonadota bacterium]